MAARSTSLLAAVVVMSLGAAASAQSVSAREHFDRGVQLTRDGDLRGALLEFRAAYDGSQNPEVLFNLAATHEALNEYVEARDDVERYQRLAPPRAVARHRAEIVEALARLTARIGTVDVRLEGDDATLDVDVDGVVRRAWRDGLVLSAGHHRATVSAPGRETFHAEFDVLGGERVVLSPTLPRAHAGLWVQCNLGGAVVRVDGHDVATTPVEGPITVDEGRHEVLVVHPGYETYRTEVVAAVAGAHVEASLRWAEPVSEDVGSHLVLRASEPGVHATLDGHRVPVDGSVAVPPGQHALRVEREDFLPVTRTVDLPAGRRTRLDLRLEPTPTHRAAVLGRGRSLRLLGAIALGIGGPMLVGGAVGLGFTASSYVDAQGQIDQLTIARAACGTTGTCGNFAATAGARIDNVLIPQSNAATVGMAATSVVAGLGVAGAIVGIVGLLNAPPSDRFERAPTWFLGAGPTGASFSALF